MANTVRRWWGPVACRETLNDMIKVEPKEKVQFGIPEWIIRGLNLPRCTQRVIIVARNDDYMRVRATWYAVDEKHSENADAR